MCPQRPSRWFDEASAPASTRSQRTRREPAHPQRPLAGLRPPLSRELFRRPSRKLARSDHPSCRYVAAERNSSVPLAPPAPPSPLRPALQTAEHVSTLRACRPSPPSSTRTRLVLSLPP